MQPFPKGSKLLVFGGTGLIIAVIGGRGIAMLPEPTCIQHSILPTDYLSCVCVCVCRHVSLKRVGHIRR